MDTLAKVHESQNMDDVKCVLANLKNDREMVQDLENHFHGVDEPRQNDALGGVTKGIH